MAEGDAFIYNDAKEQLLIGSFNLSTDTMRVVLVTGYTPNIDTHAAYSDVSGVEVTGSGYTAGGSALASLAVTQDNTNDRAAWDAADLTFTALNAGTPSHAVVQRQGASATTATNKLLMYFVLGRASNGGDYTLAFNSLGLLTLT